MKAVKRNGLEECAIDQRIDLYYETHPRSPSAVHRPEIAKHGSVWVALLGPNIQEGVVGIGSSIEMALRAFDVQYLTRLRPMAA